MSRDPQNRRSIRPDDGDAPTPGAATAPFAVVSLLAQASRLTDLLPHLHQHAIDAAGGCCSLLFEHNPRTGVMEATSGFGLDVLGSDPWLPSPAEAAVAERAFAHRAPTLVADADRQMPDLTARLGMPTVLLLPLRRGADRIGLVAVGYRRPPPAAALPGDPAEVADAFVLAIELFRLRRGEDLQRDLRGVIDEFTTALSTTLNLSTSLAGFCEGANRLLGANRTSVWIHDRRARRLVLQATSDRRLLASRVSVESDDELAPPAAAMRLARAEILPEPDAGATSTLTVPLRGCRRALGAIIFEGVRIETGGALDLMDRVGELGRLLSGAIENVQLLDDVMRSQRELENAFDSITHLIVVCDYGGRIVHANQAFARRVGIERDRLLDRPLVEYVGPELAAWLAEHGAGGARTGDKGPAMCELVDPVLNGPFVVTMTDLLNRKGESIGTVVVARDRTPQTRLEAERRELRERLAQSEKLVALGQFVAGIAHELNNPLQGVLGHLELLRATGAFPKHLRREIQTIYREADRAAKIVRNLLVFAGSRRLVRRPVSLNGVLQKVVAIRAKARRAAGIELVRHYDDRLPRVLSDPLLLHQVFLNILINAEHAVAATGTPGRIDITTAMAHSPDRIVATVRDNGVGIPFDALSRVFEPFYTTKEVGKGTGLGLAIAYGIVQEHGGEIAASNHPDGGAVFTVELPTTPASGR